MESECDHEIVEDEHNVCVKCGLVMGDIFVGEKPVTSDKYYDHLFINDFYTKVADVVFYFNLPSYLINYMYHKVAQDNRNNLTSNEKLAIHLYSALIQQGNCIRLSEVCAMCEVKLKKINKYCTNINCNFEHADMLSKFCALLNISYMEQKILEQKLCDKKISGHNPCTEIGAYIYKTFPNRFSINEIAKTVNINPCSIKRYIKNILDV